MYALLNRLTAKPGQRDTVVQYLIESGELFTGNTACLMYLVAQPADDVDTIWVVDLWTTREAHAEALQAPELQPYVEKTMPLLEGMPEQIELTPRGGKV
jgi:quinol monooxygenase YgiN